MLLWSNQLGFWILSSSGFEIDLAGHDHKPSKIACRLLLIDIVWLSNWKCRLRLHFQFVWAVGAQVLWAWCVSWLHLAHYRRGLPLLLQLQMQAQSTWWCCCGHGWLHLVVGFCCCLRGRKSLKLLILLLFQINMRCWSGCLRSCHLPGMARWHLDAYISWHWDIDHAILIIPVEC